MADLGGGGQQWATMDKNGKQWARMDNNGKNGQEWARMGKNGQQSAVLHASLFLYYCCKSGKAFALPPMGDNFFNSHLNFTLLNFI